MKGRRRLWIRKMARRLFVGLSAAVLLAGMAVSVDRTSEARRLSREISELEREAEAARARVAEESRRLDSLTSRERILRRAKSLGLRPADDDEIVFLRETGAETGERRRTKTRGDE